MNTKRNSLFQKTTISIRKRKCSTAQVSLFNGNGKILINKRSADAYFQYRQNYLSIIMAPLQKVNAQKRYDIIVLVKGGGITGQAESIQGGIASLLAKTDQSYRSILKKANYLSHDTRIKERKKYGLLKARKAPQFSKR